MSEDDSGITRISVEGFKSIGSKQSIEIRPLTILAGANSSGKSSMMQPLLLLKQTLEATYDPGPLLIEGPNVRFTLASQILSHFGSTEKDNGFGFKMEIETAEGTALKTRFKAIRGRGFAIDHQYIGFPDFEIVLRPDMTPQEFVKVNRRYGEVIMKRNVEFAVRRDRCFLSPMFLGKSEDYGILRESDLDIVLSMALLPGFDYIKKVIHGLIHLPGLRGNPLRTYPVTAIGATFPGTFENYVASVIQSWQIRRVKEKLTALYEDLRFLGLASRVKAERSSDARIQILVDTNLDIRKSRGKPPRPRDSIADVGFGVSQALPVVVALHAAEPGQLVYMEQPETHLHPRAQWRLARVLAKAAKRGVRIIAETHSSLFLLGVQTAIATEFLDPEDVKLHWFKMVPLKGTEVKSADISKSGAFVPSDWPEDFGTVEMKAESDFLDAHDKKLFEENE